MKNWIIFLLTISSMSLSWATEPCPQVDMKSLLMNSLGSGKSFSDLQKVLEATSKEENVCEFALAENPNLKDVNPIKLVVQMGYIDNSLNSKDPKSYDRKIVSSIKDFLVSSSCQFEVKNENTLIRKMKNGKVLEMTFRENSNSNDLFSEKLSASNLDFIQGGLDNSHYLVTIGHSRSGKGMDFFPLQTHKATKALPIYSDKFIANLPASIRGMAVLACDSNNYQNLKGAEKMALKKNLKLVGLDKKLFNFTDSIEDFISSVHKF